MPDIKEKLVELLDIQVYDDWYSNQEIADHLIANGVTIQEWIPVEERLPEDGIKVLWVKRLGGLLMIAKYDKQRNVWTDGHHYGGMKGVTHWMPLPEPPKGE